MRAIASLGLSAFFGFSAAGVASAAPVDTVSTATRVETRARLEALLDTTAQALGFRRWYRSQSNPFSLELFYDRGLRYATRLEVVINVTRQNTIGFRVFPHWNGGGPDSRGYLDLDEARDPSGLMKEALRLSGQNFLFWGMDEAHDLFAGYTITLESGFPVEAVRIVLRSIPLVDDSVGDLARFAD